MARTGAFLNSGVDKLFKKIFTPSRLVPPEDLQRKFHLLYHQVTNLEWIEYPNEWEAIFIRNGEEYIIRMNFEGLVLDQKVNLPVQKVPPSILASARGHGEVMNVIEATTSTSGRYEIIIRDVDLNRFLLLITDTGELLQRTAL